MSVSQRTTKLQNALKIGTFQNYKQFSKGGPLEKSVSQFFKIILFHYGISYWHIIMQCKDIRMHNKKTFTQCHTFVVVLSTMNFVDKCPNFNFMSVNSVKISFNIVVLILIGS